MTTPLPSSVSRESAFRLPRPAGAHWPTLADDAVPAAVRALEETMRASVGASREVFTLVVTARVVGGRLVDADLAVPAGETYDAAALDRLQACARAVATPSLATATATEAYTIYYVVSISETHTTERDRRDVDAISGGLVAACPSFAEAWADYAADVDFDPESIHGAVTCFVEHGLELIAAGRVAELAAPLAALVDLATAVWRWEDAVRWPLCSQLINGGAARGLDVSVIAAVMPPALLPYWDDQWSRRDEDTGHDAFY